MNRLLLIGIGILCWVLTGCSNKDQAPAGILPKEKMEEVLWDMIQAERFTSTFVAKDSSKNVKTENFKLYAQVFSIHQITKEEFIKSYKFYLSRPDIARVMFDSLASKANRRREEQYQSESKKADSAKPAPPVVPATPVPTADSIQKRIRDSLMSGARKRKLGAPTRPQLIAPDSNQPAKPLRPIHPTKLRIKDSLLRHSP